LAIAILLVKILSPSDSGKNFNKVIIKDSTTPQMRRHVILTKTEASKSFLPFHE